MIPLCFDESLEQFADSTALIQEDGLKVSYAELAAKVECMREKLSGEKRLIFILCGANTQSIVAYLVSLRTGHTAALINSELNAANLVALEQQYKPDWIFEPVNQHRRYEYKEDGYGLRRSQYQNTKDLHSDLALLLSTSGTTGSPKMVKLTKKNLYANAASIIEYLLIDKDERAISSLPMHYSYGLSVLNTHLATGATIVLTDKSMISRDFWDIMKKYKVTSFAGVPYHYEMLLRLGFFKMELPSLKTLTQAGGKLSPKYVQKFATYAHDKNIRFFVMYGQTEATARISFIPADQIVDNPESVGLTIPGGKLWLQNSVGTPVKGYDQEGELVYEGSNVMMGYATCREELAAGDELCGKLLTGDLAKRMANGFFTITGRLKRFVKIFGNRVNLDDVEELLKRKGFDAICGGEDNSMVIVLTDESVKDEAKKCVVTALGVHHSAINVVIVDKFYVTASGKIDYKKNLNYATAS